MLIYKLKLNSSTIIGLLSILVALSFPILLINNFSTITIKNLFILFIFIFIIYLLVYQSFELNSNYLKVNRKIWQIFLKPEIFNIKSIDEVIYNKKASTVRLPSFEIKVTENNFQSNHIYLDTLFSFKDVKKMLEHLENLNVKVKIVNK